MLKTPARKIGRTPAANRSIRSRFPVVLFDDALKNQVSLGGELANFQMKSPPPSTSKFVPPFTSTPASELPPTRCESISNTGKRKVSRNILKTCSPINECANNFEVMRTPVQTINQDASIEEILSEQSPPPRPASEPLTLNLEKDLLENRPRTAEPPAKGMFPLIRTPSRKNERKRPCTISKTPFCARPTKSWLNRVKCRTSND